MPREGCPRSELPQRCRLTVRIIDEDFRSENTSGLGIHSRAQSTDNGCADRVGTGAATEHPGHLGARCAGRPAGHPVGQAPERPVAPVVERALPSVWSAIWRFIQG